MTRCRHQHSVSLLHLSELDFWETTCAGNCSECSKQSLRVFQTRNDQVQAECLRRVPVPDPVKGRWKRPQPENTEGRARQLHEEDNLPQTSKRQATSATATSSETSTCRGTLDELAERLGNFHDSARALASCLQKHDVSRKTDQSMTEAAKCMFHKLLEEASDNLQRVTPRSRENFCSRPETLVHKLRSRFEMPSENCVWRRTSTDTPMPQSSAESSEHVFEDDPRKQLELSVPRYEPGQWKYEFQMSSFTTTMLNLLFTEAEQNGKTRNFRMHIVLGSDGSSADKLSLDLKFNTWDTAITFRPEWRSMSKTVFTQYDSFETWYTCQFDVWLDDVKTFCPRLLRRTQLG